MRRPFLILALACHLVLATGYLRSTPLFEAPDELGHFLYVRHLLEKGDLPLIPGSAEALERPYWQESNMAHHPFLYYGLVAGLQVMAGTSDLAPTLRRDLLPNGEPDPSVWIWSHGYDEREPVSDEVRTFRVLRGFSVLLGLATLVLVHALGRRVFPRLPQVADVGTLLLACWPQWSFQHGVLDNGNLAELGCQAVFLLLAFSWAQGRIGLGQGALLGGLVGVSLLSKMTALFLLPLCAGFYLAALARWEPRRRVLAAAGLTFVVAAGCAGWFFMRNHSLYGDPLGSAAHRLAYAANLLAPERRGWYFLHRFPRELGESFVGSFGWGGLKAPWPVQALAAGLFLVALVGWGVRGSWLRERSVGSFGLLAALLLVFAGLVRFNLVFRQPQGRYLFPASGPIFLLVGAGLVGWAQRFRFWARPSVARGLALVLPLGAGGLLFGRVAPALSPPLDASVYDASLVRGLSTPALPQEATIELLRPFDGARLDRPPTFVWDPPAPREGDRYSVHLYSASGRVLAATYEWHRIELSEPRFAIPEEFWEALAVGEAVFWKVRRLPDRSRGEKVSDCPQSAAFSFTPAR